MKKRLDINKFMQNLQSVPEVSIEEEKCKRKERDMLFSHVIFDAEKVSDVEDVPTETLIQMLEEIDHHLGGPLPFENRREHIVSKVAEEKQKMHSRVL